MFPTCHWFRLSTAWTLAQAKWPQVQWKSFLCVSLVVWNWNNWSKEHTAGLLKLSHPLLTGNVLDLCPAFPLSILFWLFLWFILQLSTKYVLAGQIRLRIISHVVMLAIKCFIYLPKEEFAPDRGERECVHVCIMCGFKQRSFRRVGPISVLCDSRGSSGWIQAEDPVTTISHTSNLLIPSPQRDSTEIYVDKIVKIVSLKTLSTSSRNNMEISLRLQSGVSKLPAMCSWNVH